MAEFVRFIVFSAQGGYGNWGAGNTQEEATKQWRKAGGKGKKKKIYKFTAQVPFAPAEREATEQEADSYVDKYGSMCWVRCEREQIAENSALV